MPWRPGGDKNAEHLMANGDSRILHGPVSTIVVNVLISKDVIFRHNWHRHCNG
jgi:hypothetical protein